MFVIVLICSMLLLSIYAVRWVIAPLAEVARAATSFGRSPGAPGVLRRRGPLEIAQVADALNDMRTRIRALLDDHANAGSDQSRPADAADPAQAAHRARPRR